MTREHNWADNHTFHAARLHRPASIDEVRRIVVAARNVRAIGMRHSFNGIADAEDIVDLCHLDPRYVIDPERMTVTLGANTTYGALAAHLEQQGYALHNMASLPHVSVAGATATGTHGSGDGNGTLSTAVAGLELVTAAGDVVQVARGDAGFDGMVVGLGAFGIVTRITLDIEPSYRMQQDAFVDLPWQTLLTKFDAVSSVATSVNLLTKWSADAVDRMWCKTRLPDGRARSVSAAHLGASAAPLNRISSSVGDPNLILYPFGGVPGPWSERLPHFRLDCEPGTRDQIQSEYMLPRTAFPAAATALRAMGQRIDTLLRATEIRTMAADGLWLSPAYGRDTVAIHFTWKREHEAVGRITREIEDLLLPMGGRPHWGKLLHADADALAGAYPQMSAFRALAESYDPGRKFRNAYLEAHVFSAE